VARPNIVWFRSEDNSAEFIGAYGDRLARTPTIDRLARDGVLYRNAFSTSPVCAPTKLAMTTGLYEASMGPGQNMRALGKRPQFAVGFANWLQDAGYWTTTSGNTDYNTDIGADAGYDDSTGNWKGRPAGAPFFALLGSSTSHETSTFAPTPTTTDPAAVRLPAYHPDSPVLREDRARYYDNVARMDGEVAQLLQDLEDAGELEHTIVIYSSDHGGVLPGSKRFACDSGLRIPLVVRFPKRLRHLAPAAPGSVVDAPVSTIDGPPTVRLQRAEPDG
jgi:arylsulfatase A-like enzyme